MIAKPVILWRVSEVFLKKYIYIQMLEINWNRF